MKSGLSNLSLGKVVMCLPSRFLFAVAFFLLSGAILLQAQEASIQWKSSINVGVNGGPSSIGLADWLYDVITTSSGNYLAVGFANEDEETGTHADKPAYVLVGPTGNLIKDGVVDAANPTTPSGRLYSVCEAPGAYYAVGNFDGQGIIVKIDKATLDHEFATFVAGSNSGARMGDITDVGGQYLLVSGWSGGRRWLNVFDYDMNQIVPGGYELPASGVDDRMEAIQYEVDPGTGLLSIYFAGKEVTNQDGGFGSYRRWDSDIRVGKVTYDPVSKTFAYTPGTTVNSINQGDHDMQAIQDGPAAVAGTIFQNYPPTFKDHYPYGPMYRGTNFSRDYTNCSEKEPIPDLEFIEDWSDGSEDEPYSMELSGNYIVVSALLNKLIMWENTNDNLGKDTDGGFHSDPSGDCGSSCNKFNSDYYLWGEGYLLFFNKSTLTFHHAVHLGTFSGGDFNARMVKTADGGFAVVGTITGCPQDEPQVSGTEHMMVIQTDANGNVKWRKHFNGLGQGACGFGITVAPDGGLIVVGNSEGEGPNHEENFNIIKLGSSCDYTADVVPNQGHDYVLQQDENWTTNRTVNARVVVPAGRRLVISGSAANLITIRFADSREVSDFSNPAPVGIRVEAGGMLYVSYATLTGWDCGVPKMWDGINVEGQPTLTQTISMPGGAVGNQGYCRLIFATIENARAGVVADATWAGVYPPVVTTFAGTGSQSTMLTSAYFHGADRGGARIEAFFSDFLNNRRDAIFMRYPHNWNNSRFFTCHFTNNGPLVDPNMIGQPAPNVYNSTEPLGTSIHASIWSTRVFFSGCTFTGSSAIVNGFKPVGIGSFDGRVVANGGSMTDLKIGIESATNPGGLLANINAASVTFNNCVQGITMRNSTADRISNCTFNSIPFSSLVQGMAPCGIFGQFAGGSTILNNTFNGLGGKSRGIVMHNTAGNGAEIRENAFFSCQVGTQLEGDNSELIARCNDYTNMGQSGWAVLFDDFGNGVLHDQGAGPGAGVQKADNEFFDPCTGLSDLHLLSEFEFNYYDKTGNTHHAESNCVNSIIDFDLAADNSATQCVVVSPCPNPPCDPKEQYYSSGKTVRDRNIALDALIHTGVDANNYLNPSLYADAKDILRDRHQAADRMLLIGTYFAEGDYANAQTELTALTGTSANVNAYRNYMTNLLAGGTSLLTMPASNTQQALSFMTTAGGTSAQALAQNLDFLRNEVYHPLDALALPALKPGQSATAAPTVPDAPANWVTAPNPFNSEIRFMALVPAQQEVLISVFNLFGQKVWETRALDNGPVVWQTAGNAPDGTYFYTIRSAQGVVQTGKVMKVTK